jgi:predicted metalloprotease with PDZ domain
MQAPSDGYLQFLELCSHEYFHLWNVKRIQPEVFQVSDLKEPAYTNQLWWFEGVTSYYDLLILLRAGIIEAPKYLDLLAQQMTRVYRMPGRFTQSVAESSWFSWTKFYQQDENAPNAIISYYTKGSLLALGLDLLIRQQSGYQKSLDDVLLHLWEHYGKPEIGLKEYQIEAICEQVAGCSLEAFFNRYLYGTEDLPLADWLKAEQVTFSLRGMSGLQDTGGESKNEVLKGFLGANFADTEHQSVKITHVWSDQPAYHAGLAAGDEIVALNGLKVANCAALEQRLKRVSMQENTVWECHYFRRDELRVTQLTPQSPVKDRVQLSLVSKKELALSPWLATMHNHQQG